jgi:cellobiose phosphorylase
VAAALKQLVSPADRLIRLFTPPFDKSPPEPGYVKGYVPGIRENGGQYTHAAVWLVQAVAGLGHGTTAMELWKRLSPVESASTPEAVARYRVEPYVVPADVYGEPPNLGRGGWTWYTGSAGWLLRAAVETILGFTRRGEILTFDPRIPAAWPGFSVEYRFGLTRYRCRIENPHAVERGVAEVWVDQVKVADRTIRLVDNGQEHHVRIVMGDEWIR